MKTDLLNRSPNQSFLLPILFCPNYHYIVPYFLKIKKKMLLLPLEKEIVQNSLIKNLQNEPSYARDDFPCRCILDQNIYH